MTQQPGVDNAVHGEAVPRHRGTAEVMEDVRDSSPLRHALGELVSCPLCLDMWVATGFTTGLLFAQG